VARTNAEGCVDRSGLDLLQSSLSLDCVCEARTALPMSFSVYVTLGIFLLFASRCPSANRSLIAFTAWSSFVLAMLMAGQAFAGLIARGELIGSAVLVVVGIALIVSAPAQESVERLSAQVT